MQNTIPLENSEEKKPKINNDSSVIASETSPEIIHHITDTCTDPPFKKRRVEFDGNDGINTTRGKNKGNKSPSIIYQPRKNNPPRLPPKIYDKHSLEGADYFFENGLRKVAPYFYEYHAFAKGRWLGKSILDLFCVEFRDRSAVYYAQAISKGWIKVNGVQVSPNTIIRNQDIISHKIHRHEPPVTSDEIRILSEDKDVIVIDKPGSIPVHPSGRYRHNTVIHILRKERAYGCLHPVNRLDRLTSGLMILALTPQKAQEFESQMQQRSIKKEYICRVLGEFPKGKVICDKPIRTVSNKLGLNVVHESGRACTTVFERVSWNGRTSVIKCFPQTGRTHQIRVHLQYLGHSVCNDPLYANKSVWGPAMGKDGINETETQLLIQKLSKEGIMDEGERVGGEDLTDVSRQDLSSSPTTERLQPFFCNECNIPRHPDPLPHQLSIWLHAYKYEGDGWQYESSELPSWTNEDFDGDWDYC